MSRIVLQGAKLDVIVLHVLSNDSKEFSMPKSVQSGVVPYLVN